MKRVGGEVVGNAQGQKEQLEGEGHTICAGSPRLLRDGPTEQRGLAGEGPEGIPHCRCTAWVLSYSGTTKINTPRLEGSAHGHAQVE